MKIRKGDKVQIIKGKDRVKRGKAGKSNVGKVLAVLADREKVVVEGLNLRFKHVRPKKEGEKGQRIEFPAPLGIGNVMLLCPKCNQPTRVGYKRLASDLKGAKKIRICRKCREAID
ncbi:MAG: 50S ribosomal protein L24 [Parcubacteria group bacterium]